MAVTVAPDNSVSHLWQPDSVKIVDGRSQSVRDVVVHRIRMGDMEDPDLWVSDAIWQWQQTEAGQFVMAQAQEKPYWHRIIDQSTYGWTYLIVARLTEADECFWRLKWN